MKRYINYTLYTIHWVCVCMRCNAFHRINEKVNMRDQQWVNQGDKMGKRMRARRKKRCKQNRKCFHYVENLVIRISFFALNACCFGYWLFFCNNKKKQQEKQRILYSVWVCVHFTSERKQLYFFPVILATAKSVFFFLS